MHIWNQCGVLSPLLPYNLHSSFACFLWSVLFHLYFLILCHLTWSLLVPVTFLHCFPCVIISFSCTGLWSVVIFLHTYLCATFILPWIVQFMSCGEIPSFSLLLTACDLFTFAELKITYGFISLLKGTFFISVESTCALAQALHTQNAVLAQMLYI